jgi:predicted nucleic-acid-binding protein
MRAVDTNVLVRAVTGDDPRQTKVADAFIAAGAWASLITLAETVWVLHAIFHFSASRLAEALDMLLNHEMLTIQDADAVSAALVLFRANPSLEFADCLILELARKAGHLPLGTFDRRLTKLAGTQKL